MMDEDVVGKAYDSRLMRRLLGYLRPYRRNAILALVAIIAGSVLQLARRRGAGDQPTERKPAEASSVNDMQLRR